MTNNSTPARHLKFLVRDKNSHHLLGVFSLSSDFRELTPRDEYIGWTRDVRFQPGMMVNHTANVSTCVPTQPFGFNFLGGKLIALLAASDVAENAWTRVHGHKLVGLTTTSLYGAKADSGGTQYRGLKGYWKDDFRETQGQTAFEPTRATLCLAREFLRQEFPFEYWKWTKAKNAKGGMLMTDAKQRSLRFIYSKLGIPKSLIETGHKRGVYFAELFQNTCAFLRKECSEGDLVRRFNNDTETLVSYWREYHAKGRIRQLERNRGKEGKKQPTHTRNVFYLDLATMSWEQVKEKYLEEKVRAR